MLILSIYLYLYLFISTYELCLLLICVKKSISRNQVPKLETRTCLFHHVDQECETRFNRCFENNDRHT